MTLDTIIVSIAAGITVLLLVMGVSALTHRQSLTDIITLATTPGGTTPSRGHQDRLAGFISRAGWRFSVTTLLSACGIASAVLLAVLGVALHPIVIAIPIALVTPVGIAWWIGNIAFVRREKSIEKQLVPALTTILTPLTVGQPIDASIAAAAKRCPQPLRGELEMVARAHSAGVPIDTALSQAAERLHNQEFKFFATATSLAMAKGGDLPRVLAAVIHSVVDRIEMRANMRTKIAEAKIAEYVLGAVPGFILLMYAFTSPTQMQALSHGLGLIIMIVALALWAGGIVATSAMVRKIERTI